MRVQVLILLLTGFLIFPSWAGKKVRETCGLVEVRKAQYNVLFLIANDLTLQLGCYGDKAARTPSLDRLASEGVVFERAYAAGTVCTPNRKSLLSGLNVKTVGWGNSNFAKDNPGAISLPRWFREHGYQTVKIGSVAHTDEYEGANDWDINLNKTEVLQVGKLKANYTFGSSAKDGNFVMRARLYPDDQKTLDQCRTEAFESFILQKWDRSKPFFFALGFNSVHDPNDANQRHFDQHPPCNMPVTVAPKGATAMTKPFPESYRWWSVDFPEDQQRLAVQGYYAAATMMDEMIGRAVDFLETEGLRDNTIIVFVADHGYNLGYRNNWAKHILYPSILRIPLIISDPGMNNKNVRVKGLVELQDIFPTLSELAGLPAPKGIHGVSAVKLMENPDGKGKRAVFAQGILHEGSGMVVTTENGTYMEWDKGKYREYYDISKDPDAWYNLVGNPEYHKAIKQHKRLLNKYFNK